MLNISSDTLPQTRLSYLAFRLAFKGTYERIVLSRQMGHEGQSPYGYLTEVPFFQFVAPQVQLDLLVDAWARHVADDPHEANLVDEAVVYAVCETAAIIVEKDRESANRYLQHGPIGLDFDLDSVVADELRELHLNLSSDGDFLLISQFEDMAPAEAVPLKLKFGLEKDRLDAMFDVLGRWQISSRFAENLKVLLQESEIAQVAEFFQLKSQSS